MGEALKADNRILRAYMIKTLGRALEHAPAKPGGGG
jgi:hypothetical protein